MNRRAVIFDMDGVLIDSYHAHLAAWQRLGEKLGRPITEEAFVPTFGRVNREIFHHLWGDAFTDDDIRRWGDWKEVEYRRIVTEQFPGMDGAGELLDALAAAGFALAVGSSGPPENVEVALRGMGRARLFDAVVNGREVTRGKPDPEVFLKAAEKLGVAPKRCAVVEDSLAGLEAARRAGMTPIGLTGTFPRERLAEKAALVVDSLRELSPERIAGLIDAHL
ncbi:MAG: HAD family phosphatase [Planctomycetes bacterium]|nr:HAD family phosphatase [Planctomycetota bacterium]